MLIDRWTSVQKVMETTGLSADDILKMDMSEYGRLTGRQSPAEAATQALDAQYAAQASEGQEQPPVPADSPQQPPQGIDISQLSMGQYAQLRAQLGVTGREYGRGALDGGSTADWVQAAQRKAGRSGWQGGNVQESPRVDGRMPIANEPVTGRARFYR